ncbi:MAG: hypothetical protein KDC54_21300, partial [Lewinella sp.]|nr:hypothetical protein [Lewinella sp.]
MKKGYAWLIFSLGLTVSLSAQTLAEWQLDDLNYAQATNVATNLTAADFQRGNGISAITYAPTGATASNWSAFTSRESADYFEICVTADNGRTVEITGISYQERRTADGIRTFDLRYSTDGFATNTLLDNVLVPDNTLQRFHSSSMSMKIKPGEQICYRWYGYQSEADAGEWEIDNITLSGTVLAPCAAPTSIGTITPNTITPTTMRLQLGAGGDGVARIIFMRAGAPVEAIPCQGDSYVADNHFGDGDQVGPDTYVVGLTASDNANILITGLSPGTTYYVAVYEFSSLCYYNTPATASAATDCHVASPAYAEMTAPLDGRVSMLWTNPGCADQVLVLASPSPISGTPTGDGSQYVPNVMYGAGTYSADFSAGAYPVYVGTGEHLTVTGLSNGTLYYFAIFTYYNGSWSVALTFTETPVNGCDELGGDHVFVNEFHYWDAGVDQDEGVEIIGPAGTDLSLYEVYI